MTPEQRMFVETLLSDSISDSMFLHEERCFKSCDCLDKIVQLRKNYEKLFGEPEPYSVKDVDFFNYAEKHMGSFVEMTVQGIAAVTSPGVMEYFPIQGDFLYYNKQRYIVTDVFRATVPHADGRYYINQLQLIRV